jgi:hypothetical protein
VTPKQIIDVAIQPLSDLLRESGFSRVGRRFFRDIGECRVFLEIQASRWNRDQVASFTANLAVFSPPLLRKLGRDVPAPPTSEVGCTWYEPIGFATPQRIDLWWKIANEAEIIEVSKNLVAVVRDFALPWLESAATYEGLREILRLSGGVPAADLLWTLGHNEDAIICIKSTPPITSGRVKAVAEWLRSHANVP